MLSRAIKYSMCGLICDVSACGSAMCVT